MEIDEAIEDHVRTAFSAAIGHNPNDLKAALGQIDARDFPVAVSYAIYVCGYIVSDVFNGERRDTGIAEMAEYVVADNKEWVDLGSAATVAEFLKAAAAGDMTSAAVAGDEVAGQSFVIGGYLLSRFRHAGQRWFEYLDDIWNGHQATQH